MKKPGLKERLVRYFQRNHSTWIAKGDIERLVKEYTNYTAENMGRRLRELEDAGVLEVKLVKNHAHYRLVPQMSVEEMVAAGRAMVDYFDSLPVVK